MSLFRPGRRQVWPMLLSVGLVSGCVTYMPVDEYSIARAAYDAARDADSARYAPALWFNTEQAYREGQKLFKERDYISARARFVQAKLFAEQAENAARLARHQSGDVVP
jgi:hypothetical protein